VKRIQSTIMLALALSAATAAAGPPSPGTMPASLAVAGVDRSVTPLRALGRVFQSESGWDSLADQHLIVAVFERRIQIRAGERVKAMPYPNQMLWIAKQYSTRTFAPDEVKSVGKSDFRSERQRWINGLSPACEPPQAWPLPPHPPWSVYLARCQSLFRTAQLFLDRRPPGRCQSDVAADHWGGPMDDERAHRFGWIRADWRCVDNEGRERLAVNRAWCDPSISACSKSPVDVR
jgi:hypothetical protein